jgi:hypothetical protein
MQTTPDRPTPRAVTARRVAWYLLDCPPTDDPSLNELVAELADSLLTARFAVARVRVPARSIIAGMHVQIAGMTWTVRRTLHVGRCSLLDLGGISIQLPAERQVGVL